MRALLVALSILAAAPGFAARREVGEDDIRAAVDAALRRIDDGRTTADVRTLPRLVTDDAAGPAVLDVALPDGPPREGVLAFPMTCRAGGRVVSQGLVTIAVSRDRPVWVAARPVPAGATLTAADVRGEIRRFDRAPSREVASEPEAGRWIARRALEPGAILKTTDLVRRPDVVAGAELALVSRVGAAAVSVPALARRAGDVGETILVVNPLTREIVEALLVDARTAVLARPVARRVDSRSAGGTP
jgi:flagella basal body P-ring formation protein FlgA